MQQIIAKDNKWVKEYCKLGSSKAYRHESGRFVIEGVKLVKEAYENEFPMEMIFVTHDCAEKKSDELSELLGLPNCFQITPEIEKKLCDTKTPQGIFAICKKLDKTLQMDKIYPNGRYVMLVELQDSGNVGTIIRTAEAMGFDGVIVTANTCDIYSPKVLRASMGSVIRMPILVAEDKQELLRQLSDNGVTMYASVLDSDAAELSMVNFKGPFVLLIGNEGNGLDRETVSICNEKITIKMHGRAESLNASMAACILMYEATKNK